MAGTNFIRSLRNLKAQHENGGKVTKFQLQIPMPWTETTESEAHLNAVEQAVQAEEAGFDRIWITEQHFYVEIGHSAAPDMMLAAMSQRTKRIR